MINALIIEDEKYIRQLLRSTIEELAPDINIIGECAGVRDGLAVIEACQPQLIFLDINLKDGNGFELLEKSLVFDFEVIFITAYEEYALQALKCNAVDYILKPIDSEELSIALNKAQARLLTKHEDAEEGLSEKDRKRLLIRSKEDIKIIHVDELLYCQAEGGYTHLFLLDGQRITASKPLGYYEQLLPDFFFRIHQSYHVNIYYVDRYDKNNRLYLRDSDQVLPVSVRKEKAFIDTLESL